MPMDDPYDLQRFVAAQNAGNTHGRAVNELRRGRKTSHWMWFVFPQIAGLGESATSRRYAIVTQHGDGPFRRQDLLVRPLLGRPPRCRAAALYRTHQETHIAATDSGTFISCSPDVRGGRPHIAGTGVTIRRIAALHNQGASPEAIAERIGHLSLAQVHAALSCYYANRAEIDADLAEEAAAYDRLEREHAQRPQTA